MCLPLGVGVENVKDIQGKKTLNIYENRMFFKGYIKICTMAAPIRDEPGDTQLGTPGEGAVIT